MKKSLITTVIFILVISVCTYAQKKPNFSFNGTTMAELGLSAEQQQKITEIKTKFGVEFGKIAKESNEYAAAGEKRMDSVLTDGQKQKAMAMKEAVKAENKANPALRKSFEYNLKVMDELGLSPDQQKTLTSIKGKDQVGRWQNTQKMNKLSAQVNLDQENVLNEAQKQKVAEMKAAILAHNKTVQ